MIITAAMTRRNNKKFRHIPFNWYNTSVAAPSRLIEESSWTIPTAKDLADIIDFANDSNASKHSATIDITLGDMTVRGV